MEERYPIKGGVMSNLWKPETGLNGSCLVIVFAFVVFGIIFFLFVNATESVIASFWLTIVALSVIGGIIGGF